MIKKWIKYLVGPLAFWSGLWLVVSGVLELAHPGFVVHYVNTRWIILLFGVAGAAWIITGAQRVSTSRETK